MHPSLLGDAYKAAPALRLLRALEERTMDGQYQVLWLTEIPQYTSKEEAV